MKRRTYLAGLGSLAAASGLTVGSGAFSSVSTERSLTVETAGDAEGLLSLQQLGSGGRSEDDGTPEKVEFSFPGTDRRLADSDIGLGTDSVYEFDNDADESGGAGSVDGLLKITNQGTQPVEVYSEHPTSSEIEIELYDVTDPDRTALRDEPATLAVGEHVDVGFRIRTNDAGVGTFDETLRIVAQT